MSVAPVSSRASEPLWRRVIASPSTGMGRLAAWLAGGGMLWLALAGGLVAGGVPGWGPTAASALVLASMVGLLAALVAGGVAVTAVARGERSIVVLGPLLFAAASATFVVEVVAALA